MTAAEQTITCDQAIFTSVRTPMGEGYRIIAASQGLKADERQEITRNSPSHGSLCPRTIVSEGPDAQDDQADPVAIHALSFYPLSSGRLCVGLSFPAGAEQSGRGGERVYTHVVVLDSTAFARWGYSPFMLARAMVEAGLTEPHLKPPPKLPELVLPVPASPSAWSPGFGTIQESQCVSVLEPLYEQRSVVIHAPTGWIEAAEAFWLSLPGPLRAKLSMCAGLKFASARSYNLQLMADEKGAARTRIAGTRAVYIDTTSDPDDGGPARDTTSSWTTFVRRHWSQDDWDGLARRTSQAFSDVAPTGRQRIGQLYNTLDELPRYDTLRLLNVAAEHVEDGRSCGVEQGIVTELLQATQRTILSRLSTIPGPTHEPLWRGLVRLWWQSERGTAFAAPLIPACLRAVSSVDPIAAAEAALDVAADQPVSADQEALQAVVVEVVARWAEAVERIPVDGSAVDGNPDPRIVQSRAIAERWKRLRPDCAFIQRVHDRCEELLTHRCATSG